MLVIPAIDLKDGQCVRLYQGDYRQVTVFDNHPADVARRWQEQGARLLHVVDLDGAVEGRSVNRDAIRSILAEVTVPVQVGGGLRAMEMLDDLVGLGVARLILGTAAVEDRALVAGAVARWGSRIVVGIDARSGFVATRGWQQASETTALDLARSMVALGVGRVIYTDIARDGTLTQPNFTATAELVAAVPVAVIASGGVATVDHIRGLAALGVEGAIVGRALYTGALDLREALAAAEEA